MNRYIISHILLNDKRVLPHHMRRLLSRGAFGFQRCGRGNATNYRQPLPVLCSSLQDAVVDARSHQGEPDVFAAKMARAVEAHHDFSFALQLAANAAQKQLDGEAAGACNGMGNVPTSHGGSAPNGGTNPTAVHLDFLQHDELDRVEGVLRQFNELLVDASLMK
jgi:hypothetical protein